MAAMKMRQSLSTFERAFVEEAEADRLRRERIYRQAEQRLDARRRERVHKHGSLRFFVLVLVLLATAVAVTIAMFETLYIVMG
jgi:membrane glycosyltransferase